MPRSELTLSGYKTMWLMAMFDLPVDDKVARRRYARFRGMLLDNGFSQLQYSVYARCCESETTADVQRKKIVAKLPPEGHIRLIMITDRQFEKMET
ncbi:MAG: CRISPR-associated endonuclease Cas2, partial [Planctomycetaceae bacterium]|nr:CRISPR-associated endonuclease Cas2 [Planctomycetaceae bacterium]